MTSVRVLTGNCLETLKTLPDESVQCCVTSPPYWGLRDYGNDGQLGLEATPDEYVANMVEVFREVRRVLRSDGTLWLNLGDSYNNAGSPRNGTGLDGKMRGGATGADGECGYKKRDLRHSLKGSGIKHKDLVGIPWRVAFALQADGWWLRQDIIWHKPNPMPESVTDRCTKSHEYVFLLTKSERYFYDADAIREPQVFGDSDRQKKRRPDGWKDRMTEHGSVAGGNRVWEIEELKNDGWPCGSPVDGMRNKRSVWTVTTKPFGGAHFAVMPEALVEPCILAGTSEKGCCSTCGAPWERVVETFGGRDWRSDRMKSKGIPGELSGEGSYKRGQSTSPLNDTKQRVEKGWKPTCGCPSHDPVPCTVLDPFGGSGTVGVVASRWKRDAVLCELNPEYVKIIESRIASRGMVEIDSDRPSSDEPTDTSLESLLGFGE